MRILFSVFLIAGTLAYCKKDDCCDRYGIDKVWLDATIADIEKSSGKEYYYIVRAEYDGMCVAFVSSCCPNCLMATILYTCAGTKLENPDVTKLKNTVVVWTPDNSACYFPT